LILVTTGTNGTAFDRLLRELDDLAPGEEVVIQHGPSTLRPSGARCVEYLPFAAVSQLIATARVVVTHGGAGSVLAALSSGHRPLVVPRLAASGEAIDDHQLWFAERLERESLVTVVDDPRRLRSLARVDTRFARPAVPGSTGLREELGAYLRGVVGAAG
jgi:UDP-N-acetylglucosamine transferase subunit ALG13